MSERWIEVEAIPSVAITVERKSHGVPSYAVFGEVRCHRCREWCWLGRGPFQFVAGGKGLPHCVECMQGVASPENVIGEVP